MLDDFGPVRRRDARQRMLGCAPERARVRVELKERREDIPLWSSVTAVIACAAIARRRAGARASVAVGGVSVERGVGRCWLRSIIVAVMVGLGLGVRILGMLVLFTDGGDETVAVAWA